MAQVAIPTADPMPAAAAAIDRDQLKRMTFGDRSLERELLQLFDRQAEILIARMHASDAPVVATLAHTLKGSACGIGAGNVAHAAQAAELAAERSPAELGTALAVLANAVDEARALIAELLRAH
jgi:HPt (histidine-containing phosphotransfer) domain-containing protein